MDLKSVQMRLRHKVSGTKLMIWSFIVALTPGGFESVMCDHIKTAAQRL